MLVMAKVKEKLNFATSSKRAKKIAFYFICFWFDLYGFVFCTLSIVQAYIRSSVRISCPINTLSHILHLFWTTFCKMTGNDAQKFCSQAIFFCFLHISSSSLHWRLLGKQVHFYIYFYIICIYPKYLILHSRDTFDQFRRSLEIKLITLAPFRLNQNNTEKSMWM